MKIPEYVNLILDKLRINNFSAYLVGGSVRDFIMNKPISDYDITTNASTLSMLQIFKDYNIINNNGLKHNTITIHINNDNVEITSFKCEEEELTLYNDLSHRDLTINALAYDNSYIDYFNSISDINNKIIRMVNNPYDRIKEDPIRILRALRFSSKLGFSIEDNTKKAILSEYQSLKNCSYERIREEFDKILTGDNVYQILSTYKDVFVFLIPELQDTIGFNQHNPHHKNDVYTHLINVVRNTRNNRLLRISAFLHDIAKPKCFSMDDNGIGHFYGHPSEGSIMVYDILKRFKYSNFDISKVVLLVKYHDIDLKITKKNIKKNLFNLENDEELFYLLIELINADRLDHVNHNPLDIVEIMKMVLYIKSTNECLKISDLKINGYDLMNLGFKGKEIGDIIDLLFNKVLDETLINDKDTLINYIKHIKVK